MFKQSKRIIEFMTDVEGNWRYFTNWLSRSNTVELKDNKLFFKQPNSMFVFGGDVTDRGNGDIRIAILLVDFKKRFPDRVELIIGNRENKYPRFLSETRIEEARQRLMGESTFWTPDKAPRIFIEACMQQEGEENIETFLASKSDEECLVMLVKWMLRYNMGCGEKYGKPETFEYRRSELALLHPEKKEITDMDVVNSFIDMVKPDGVITEYLKLGKLAAIIGDTLFVHGGITRKNMGHVPGRASDETLGLRDWVTQLNGWYHRELLQWIEKPFVAGPPGDKSMDHYAIQNPLNIMTSDWYIDGKLAPLDAHVVHYLSEAGVRYVCSGHQPYGDYPLILTDDHLTVITADTSYSDMQNKEDNRGAAVNTVLIHQGDEGTLSIDLDINRKDQSHVLLSLPDHQNNPYIGRFTPDGWLVGPQCGEAYSLRGLDGWTVTEKLSKEEELVKMFAQSPINEKM